MFVCSCSALTHASAQARAKVQIIHPVRCRAHRPRDHKSAKRQSVTCDDTRTALAGLQRSEGQLCIATRADRGVTRITRGHSVESADSALPCPDTLSRLPAGGGAARRASARSLETREKKPDLQTETLATLCTVCSCHSFEPPAVPSRYSLGVRSLSSHARMQSD